MMLLRDMTLRGTRRGLLDRVVFLFVPVLGPDGHERFGPHNRVNQRGPLATGWRTNGRNLNLNRDYAKLDTPELRAVVGVINRWRPDLYLDIHVTDGADYQYDITWGWSGTHAHSPHIAAWLETRFQPVVAGLLEAQGHIPGPLVFAADKRDMTKGIRLPTFSPRSSHGYGDVRHLPSILVENHSLKPFDQRVLGTYVFLEGALRALAEGGRSLRAAMQRDRSARRIDVPLAWKVPDGDVPRIGFLGIEQRLEDSPVTGGKRVVWTGEPVTLEVPVLEATEASVVVTRPRAYWVPANWPEVIQRLRHHGIRMERIRRQREVDVGLYRIKSHELAKAPFEGHVRVKAEVELERHTERYPPGSVRIPTDQPLGNLAMALLEPEAPDSFFQWGFFHEILQRTEYVESYVMDPLAERMLARDPELKRAYEERLGSDEAFRKSPRARLQWFYERTPWFDTRWRLYPVGREEAP